MKIQIYSHDILCPPLLLELQKEGADVLLSEKEKSKTLEGTIKRGVHKNPDLVIFDDVGFKDEPVEMRKKGIPTVGGNLKSDAMELDRIKGIKIAQLMGIKTPRTESFDNFEDMIKFIKENPARYIMKQEKLLDGIKGMNFASKKDDSSDLLERIEWLKERWVDGLVPTFVIQQFIEGREIACGSYFNSNEFMKDKNGNEICEENFETKPLCAGDLGQATGEMYTLLRYRLASESLLFKETLDKAREVLTKIGFIGDVDANCIVNKEGVWILEWTMRFGSPASSGQIAIHKTKWSEFLLAMAKGEQVDFEYDPRWTIIAWIVTPPFPYAEGDKIKNLIEEKYKKNPPKNTDEKKDLLESRLMDSLDVVLDFKEQPTKEELENIHPEYVYYKNGKIRLANSGGYGITVSGQGETVKEAGEKTEKLLKKILLPSRLWRNDFGAHYFESRKDLIKWGYLQDDSTIEEQLAEKAKQEEKDKQTKEITEKIQGDYDKKLSDIKGAVKGIIYGNK